MADQHQQPARTRLPDELDTAHVSDATMKEIVNRIIEVLEDLAAAFSGRTSGPFQVVAVDKDGTQREIDFSDDFADALDIAQHDYEMDGTERTARWRIYNTDEDRLVWQGSVNASDDLTSEPIPPREPESDAESREIEESGS